MPRHFPEHHTEQGYAYKVQKAWASETATKWAQFIDLLWVRGIGLNWTGISALAFERADHKHSCFVCYVLLFCFCLLRLPQYFVAFYGLHPAGLSRILRKLFCKTQFMVSPEMGRSSQPHLWRPGVPSRHFRKSIWESHCCVLSQCYIL